MSKHFKETKVRNPASPKALNHKRRLRRKAARAKVVAKIEYMKGWAS